MVFDRLSGGEMKLKRKRFLPFWFCRWWRTDKWLGGKKYNKSNNHNQYHFVLLKYIFLNKKNSNKLKVLLIKIKVIKLENEKREYCSTRQPPPLSVPALEQISISTIKLLVLRYPFKGFVLKFGHATRTTIRTGQVKIDLKR